MLEKSSEKHTNTQQTSMFEMRLSSIPSQFQAR